MGNAERLIGRYGGDLRYCAAWGRWLIWDGKRWVADRTKKIFWLAKETVLGMRSEAKVTDDDDERSKIRSACRASQRAARLDAMCRVAEADRMVAITPEQLDQDPFLLNCKNGTLHLKTGEFRKHRRRDMLTKTTPVEFSESATCPICDMPRFRCLLEPDYGRGQRSGSLSSTVRRVLHDGASVGESSVLSLW